MYCRLDLSSRRRRGPPQEIWIYDLLFSVEISTCYSIPISLPDLHLTVDNHSASQFIMFVWCDGWDEYKFLIIFIVNLCWVDNTDLNCIWLMTRVQPFNTLRRQTLSELNGHILLLHRAVNLSSDKHWPQWLWLKTKCGKLVGNQDYQLSGDQSSKFWMPTTPTCLLMTSGQHYDFWEFF